MEAAVNLDSLDYEGPPYEQLIVEGRGFSSFERPAFFGNGINESIKHQHSRMKIPVDARRRKVKLSRRANIDRLRRQRLS